MQLLLLTEHKTGEDIKKLRQILNLLQPYRKLKCNGMVRIRGLEPPPPCEDQHLKLARLPIPPYPHM